MPQKSMNPALQWKSILAGRIAVNKGYFSKKPSRWQFRLSVRRLEVEIHIRNPYQKSLLEKDLESIFQVFFVQVPSLRIPYTLFYAEPLPPRGGLIIYALLFLLSSGSYGSPQCASAPPSHPEGQSRWQGPTGTDHPGSLSGGCI